jgi:hypothetical protein
VSRVEQVFIRHNDNTKRSHGRRKADPRISITNCRTNRQIAPLLAQQPALLQASSKVWSEQNDNLCFQHLLVQLFRKQRARRLLTWGCFLIGGGKNGGERNSQAERPKADIKSGFKDQMYRFSPESTSRSPNVTAMPSR